MSSEKKRMPCVVKLLVAVFFALWGGLILFSFWPFILIVGFNRAAQDFAQEYGAVSARYESGELLVILGSEYRRSMGPSAAFVLQGQLGTSLQDIPTESIEFQDHATKLAKLEFPIIYEWAEMDFKPPRIHANSRVRLEIVGGAEIGYSHVLRMKGMDDKTKSIVEHSGAFVLFIKDSQGSWLIPIDVR